MSSLKLLAEDQIAMNQTHNAHGFRARFYSHAIGLEEEKKFKLLRLIRPGEKFCNQVGTSFLKTYLVTGP